MSDFWEKNKGSITSGLKIAGKYGYQGTKFVAKTGYAAGKKQYQNSKNRREGRSAGSGSGDDDYESDLHTASPVQSFKDPSSFPAPPLRAGQQQYGLDGKVVSSTSQVSISPHQQGANIPTTLQQPQLPTRGGFPQAGVPQAAVPQAAFPQTAVPQTTVPSTTPQPTAFGSAPVALATNNTMQNRNVPTPPCDRNAHPLPAASSPNTSQLPASSLQADATSPASALQVKPYNREAYAEESQRKINLPSVDISSLPPPPSHKDRAQIALKASVSNSSLETANTPPPTPRRKDSSKVSQPITMEIQEGALEDEAKQESITGNFNSNMASSSQPSPPPPAYRSTSNSLYSRDSERSVHSRMATDHPSRLKDHHEEESKSDHVAHKGITGAFNYDVQTSFQPPPKPHRNVEQNASLSTRPRSNPLSTREKPVIPSRSSANKISQDNTTLPPPLPRRLQNSNTVSKEAVPPPPRRTVSPPERRQVNPLPTRSFPPPPRPHTNKEHIDKKAPPPVEPKPKTLTMHKPIESAPTKENKVKPEVPRKPKVPPVVPRKPKLPPIVPKKRIELQSAHTSSNNTDNDDDYDDDDGTNPFERYLKSAVPTNENRLSRPQH